jgi:type I restriction enzyme R subunit
MRRIPPKLRNITDGFLKSRGIEVKVEPISILDEDFEKEVKSRNRTKTQAAEIEHAIRHHLDIELDDDPDLRAFFAEALSKIFEDFRDNWNKIYEELEKLRRRIVDADKEPTYGLHRKKQMPFFRMLKKEIFGDTAPDEDGVSALVSLTQQFFEDVERELKLTGFWESIPARKKLRRIYKGRCCSLYMRNFRDWCGTAHTLSAAQWRSQRRTTIQSCMQHDGTQLRNSALAKTQ